MQAKPQGISAEQATTTMTSLRLDLPSLCDICGNARSTRKHTRCSRIRQQTKQAEWEALQAEKASAREARGRRYAR